MNTTSANDMWAGIRKTLVFLTMPGDGVPAMAARVAAEGEALQQARCTTTSTEEEGVRPWTCAATLFLTSVRVASCNRLGKLTHLSFAQGKPYGISA